MTEEMKNNHQDQEVINETNVKPKGNRFVNTLLFIIWMIVVSIPTMFAFGAIGAVKYNNTSGFAISLVLFIILSILIIWGVTKYYKSRSYNRPLKKYTWKDFGINIGIFAILRAVVLILTYLMIWITGDEMSENDKILMQQLEGFSNMSDPLTIMAIVIFFISVTFIAPYVEELVFRGIFKETIFSKASFWLPMILSSIIFSLNHGAGNFIAFLLYLFMGVGMYVAYARRNDIRDSMTVHFLNNALASISMIFMMIGGM